MAYPTSSIITWAIASQPLAFIGEAKKKYETGGEIDPDLHMKIYVERKSLQWQYAQNPTDSDGILFGQGNYVYALCFPYVLEAMEITGSGGQAVVPGSSVGQSFPFVITSDDFESDGVSYVNPNIVGVDIMIFINEWTQQWLLPPDSFINTTSGIQIILPGFDANSYSYTIVIQKNNTP